MIATTIINSMRVKPFCTAFITETPCAERLTARPAFDFPDSSRFNTEGAVGSTYLVAAHAPLFPHLLSRREASRLLTYFREPGARNVKEPASSPSPRGGAQSDQRPQGIDSHSLSASLRRGNSLSSSAGTRNSR